VSETGDYDDAMKFWGNHYSMESFTMRVTTKTWRRVLLEERDRIVFQGRVRRLVAKRVGPGVYEVSKEPEVNP